MGAVRLNAWLAISPAQSRVREPGFGVFHSLCGALPCWLE